MDNRNKSGDKLPYVKPRLRIITLVAEEVLATACKQYQGQPVRFRGCGASSCRSTGGS